MSKICDAAVLSCIDFRFQKIDQSWLEKHLKNKTYDMIEIAGATKDQILALKEIGFSVKLHSIKEIHLINHEDCGAYGKESNLKNHSDDLHKAKKAIVKKYPFLKVFLHYAHLSGKFDLI